MPDCVKLPECRVSADIVQPLASLLDANTLRQKDLWNMDFGVLRGPGRPGWSPTQVPHRSGRARRRGIRLFIL